MTQIFVAWPQAQSWPRSRRSAVAGPFVLNIRGFLRRSQAKDFAAIFFVMNF